MACGANPRQRGSARGPTRKWALRRARGEGGRGRLSVPSTYQECLGAAVGQQFTNQDQAQLKQSPCWREKKARERRPRPRSSVLTSQRTGAATRTHNRQTLGIVIDRVRPRLRNATQTHTLGGRTTPPCFCHHLPSSLGFLTRPFPVLLFAGRLCTLHVHNSMFMPRIQTLL